MRERESYRELILENIEYDYPHPERTSWTGTSLDELVELMVDTVCSHRETIRIAGDDYPAEVVKSRFLKLDSLPYRVRPGPDAGEHHLCPQYQEIPAGGPV